MNGFVLSSTISSVYSHFFVHGPLHSHFVRNKYSHFFRTQQFRLHSHFGGVTKNTHTHIHAYIHTRKSGKRNDRGSFEQVPVDSEQQQQQQHHCYYGSSSGAVCSAMAVDLLDICSQTSVSAKSVDSQASSGTKLGFTACFLQRVGVCWWLSSSSCRQRQWFSIGKLFRVAGGVVLCLFLSVYFSKLVLSRANELGRQCILGGGGASTTGSGSFNGGGGGSGDRHVDGDVEQGRQRSLEMLRSYRFAMVTCSDGSRTNPQRSFEGLMELVTPNKRSYVARHGYEFVDASDVLDKERPPSWSKILAVRKSLPHYDWVFWNDAVCVCFSLGLACPSQVRERTPIHVARGPKHNPLTQRCLPCFQGSSMQVSLL